MSEAAVAMISAGIGGAVSTIALHPLDTVKTKMQGTKTEPGGKKPTIKGVLNQIIKEGGMAAVYTGVGIKTAQATITKSMYFYIFAALGGGKFSTVAGELAAGYCSELLNLPAAMPLETVANRMMVANGKLTPSQVVKQLIKEKGLFGFYSGLGANIIVAVQPAIHFGLYEQIRKSVAKGRTTLSFMESFVYGGLARAISTSFIYPYIRAKVIAQTDPEARNLTPIQILRKEYKERGMAGVFAGIEPEIIRGVLSTALMMAVKEKIADTTRSFLTGKKALGA